MSNLNYTGILRQDSDKSPDKTYTKTIKSIFKKRLQDKSEIEKLSFFGFGKKDTTYNSNNVGVAFAVLQTNNGLFNSATKRFAVLLAKDTKDLWSIPIFTMSKEKFDGLDEMLDEIFDKTTPIMKRLYDLDHITYEDVHVLKISDKKRDIYVYVLVPESWNGNTEDVRTPLSSKYSELDWFDQRTYSDDPEYWNERYFGDKTATVIQYINSFFDSRSTISSGSGMGY